MASGISHSLLGILSICPMSGYDIEKFVATNMAYFWKESYGQIYPMLKSMAKLKLVEVRAERNKGRADRLVYSLTVAGQAEVQKWLAQPSTDPSPRNELILKLFFGSNGKTYDLIHHVAGFADRHRAALKEFAEVAKKLRREQANHPGLPFWLITLDYGRRNSQSLLEWSEASLATLHNLSKKTKSKKARKTA